MRAGKLSTNDLLHVNAGIVKSATLKQPFQSLNQILSGTGFYDVALRSGPSCRSCHAAGIVHGKEKHARTYWQTGNLVGGLEATHYGHGDIHDDHVGGKFLSHAHSFLTVSGFAADFPLRLSFQHAADSLAHNFVVIGDQNLYCHLSLISENVWKEGLRGLAMLCRQAAAPQETE